MPRGKNSTKKIRKTTCRSDSQILIQNYTDLRVLEIIDAIKTCKSFDEFKIHFKQMIRNFTTPYARAILRLLLFRSGFYTQEQLSTIESESDYTLFQRLKSLLSPVNLTADLTSQSDFFKKLILRLSVEMDNIFDYYYGKVKEHVLDSLAKANNDLISLYQSKTIKDLRPNYKLVHAFLKSINPNMNETYIAQCAGYKQGFEKKSRASLGPVTIAKPATNNPKSLPNITENPKVLFYKITTPVTVEEVKKPQPPMSPLVPVDTITQKANFLFDFSIYPKTETPLLVEDNMTEHFAFTDEQFIPFKNSH